MKLKICILLCTTCIVVISLVVFFSIKSNKIPAEARSWQTIDGNYYLYAESQDSLTYTYSWSGGYLGNLIHGFGYLTKYENGQVVDKTFNVMTYGYPLFLKLIDTSVGGYLGETIDNMPSGMGLLKQNREVYFGNIENGEGNDSDATIYSLFTVVYKGSVYNGRRNGIGESYHWGRKRFYGRWINNEYNEGSLYDILGNEVFYGEFTNSIKNGDGVSYKSGEIEYVGKWRNGELYQGAYYKDGEIVYDGEFRNEKPDGFGSLYMYENDYIEYYGKWKKNSLKNGLIIINDQIVYDGDLKKLRRNGEGISYYNNQPICSGLWRKDKFKTGFGTVFQDSIMVYHGDIVDGKYEGKGIIYNSDDIIYKGDFQKGLYHGKGYLFDNNKYLFGNWENGEKIEEWRIAKLFSESKEKISNFFSKNKEDSKSIIYKDRYQFIDDLLQSLTIHIYDQLSDNIDSMFGLINEYVTYIKSKNTNKEELALMIESQLYKDMSSIDIEFWINRRIQIYNNALADDKKLQFVRISPYSIYNIANEELYNSIEARNNTTSNDVMLDIATMPLKFNIYTFAVEMAASIFVGVLPSISEEEDILEKAFEAYMIYIDDQQIVYGMLYN